MQINIGHLDEDGVYNKQFTTFALNGKTRGSVSAKMAVLLLEASVGLCLCAAVGTGGVRLSYGLALAETEGADQAAIA